MEAAKIGFQKAFLVRSLIRFQVFILLKFGFVVSKNLRFDSFGFRVIIAYSAKGRHRVRCLINLVYAVCVDRLYASYVLDYIHVFYNRYAQVFIILCRDYLYVLDSNKGLWCSVSQLSYS